MSKINLDTKKIKENGQELVELSKEFNEIIDTMFMKIANMDNMGIWIGESVIEFKEHASLEKVQYYNLKNNIYNYGKYLIDYANAIEEAVKEVKFND